MVNTEPAWEKVDGDLPMYRFNRRHMLAEEAYTITRHGGTWFLCLIDDVMRRWVLTLDGRLHVWPVAASGRPIEAVFQLADVAIDLNHDAVKRLSKDFEVQQ